MNLPRYNPWIHRIAVATAATALLPIVVGAVVTTMQWGMAFADWPTSDGHGMFSYPWLQAGAEKFTEHGHRLAGIAVGCMSILLVGVVLWREPRRGVKALGVLVLASVVAQGLLGGARVLADDRRMAMFHGNFAALVFSLMCVVALVTSRSWLESHGRSRACEMTPGTPLRVFAVFTVLALYGQSLLGGAQRHLNTMLHEHLAGAALALAAVAATVVLVHRSEAARLRRPAWTMFALFLLQALLGGGAWITKWGLASIGYVAVQGSPLQIVLRTSHAIAAMLLLASSVVLAVRVLSAGRTLESLRKRRPAIHPAETVSSGLQLEGGAG